MVEKDSNVGLVEESSEEKPLEDSVDNAIRDIHITIFYVNNLGREHDLEKDVNYKKALDTINDAIENLKPYIKKQYPESI